MRSGKRLHLWLVLAFIYIFLNIWPQGTHSAFILFIFFPPRFYPVLPVAGKVSHVDAPANSPSHALEHFNHQHSKAALRRYASDSSFLSLCLSPALSLWCSTTGCKVHGHPGKLHISSFQKIFPSRLTCTAEFVPVAHTEMDWQRTLFHKWAVYICFLFQSYFSTLVLRTGCFSLSSHREYISSSKGFIYCTFYIYIKVVHRLIMELMLRD